jgi:hypothetical protein
MRTTRTISGFMTLPLLGSLSGSLCRAAGPPVLREEAITLATPGEAVARITAACSRCSWGTRGREAAALRLEVDGRYSQHLLLTQGERPADYRVALGPLTAGPHRLTIRLDPAESARRSKRASVAAVAWEAPADVVERQALAQAPILYARPGAGFSDVPLLMWYETEATPRGKRLRYSVVFSNEDGGTPPDRLLATWGRLTDIEYVYGVELDAEGRLLGSEFQGPSHQQRPFQGLREGEHPLLFVTTLNNMVSDRGTAGVRFAPAPVAFDLADVSREAVMDAHPWTYRVSAQEVRREGRVAKDPAPGSQKIADPRRYATLEACARAEDATLAFALGVRGGGGEIRWFESDAGGPRYRIAREPHNFPNGCFRGAVALPKGVTASDLVSLSLRAHPRVPGQNEAPPPGSPGRARLTRVNALFLLNEDDQPGPVLFRWQGDELLVPGGPPFVLSLTAPPRRPGS